MDRKNRKHVIWITAVLIVGLLLLWNYWPVDNTLIVSPETTIITGPLHPDGTVNYYQYVDDLLREEVTPENNAAIEFVRAMGWRNVFKTEDDARYAAERMGVDFASWPGRDKLEDFDDYYERVYGEDLPIHLDRNYDEWRFGDTPWTSEGCPELAGYLAENRAMLDGVAAAARGQRFYVPLISQEDPPRLMDSSAMQHGDAMDVGRMLAWRANQRIGEGDLDGAWSDILALRRLGRHYESQKVLLIVMVGIATESRARAPFQNLLNDSSITPELLDRIQTDLADLPASTPIVNSIRGEQLYILDIVQLFARRNATAESWMQMGLAPNIDINRLMGNMILESDPLIDAFDQPDWPAMRDANEKLNAEMSSRFTATKKRRVFTMLALFSGRLGTRAATDATTGVFVGLLFPQLGKVGMTWGMAESYSAIAELAVAAKRYQFATGAYPESLDALVPEYLDAIPEDFMTAGPYDYKHSDAGCVIYSKGADGIDAVGVGESNARVTNAMLLGVDVGDLPEIDDDRDDVAIVLGTFVNEPAEASERAASPAGTEHDHKTQEQE